MRSANNRGWSRAPRLKRNEGRDEDIRVITDAEFYLLVGRHARHQLRQGCRPETISQTHKLSVADVNSARSFAECPPAMVLRALVENWTWRQITMALDELDATSATVHGKN